MMKLFLSSSVLSFAIFLFMGNEADATTMSKMTTRKQYPHFCFRAENGKGFGSLFNGTDIFVDMDLGQCAFNEEENAEICHCTFSNCEYKKPIDPNGPKPNFVGGCQRWLEKSTPMPQPEPDWIDLRSTGRELERCNKSTEAEYLYVCRCFFSHCYEASSTTPMVTEVKTATSGLNISTESTGSTNPGEVNSSNPGETQGSTSSGVVNSSNPRETQGSISPGDKTTNNQGDTSTSNKPTVSIVVSFTTKLEPVTPKEPSGTPTNFSPKESLAPDRTSAGDHSIIPSGVTSSSDPNQGASAPSLGPSVGFTMSTSGGSNTGSENTHTTNLQTLPSKALSNEPQTGGPGGIFTMSTPENLKSTSQSDVQVNSSMITSNTNIIGASEASSTTSTQSTPLGSDGSSKTISTNVPMLPESSGVTIPSGKPQSDQPPFQPMDKSSTIQDTKSSPKEGVTASGSLQPITSGKAGVTSSDGGSPSSKADWDDDEPETILSTRSLTPKFEIIKPPGAFGDPPASGQISWQSSASFHISLILFGLLFLA